MKELCPRCGEAMPLDPHRRALSRRSDVSICPKCGEIEALEDYFLNETVKRKMAREPLSCEHCGEHLKDPPRIVRGQQDEHTIYLIFLCGDCGNSSSFAVEV